MLKGSRNLDILFCWRKTQIIISNFKIKVKKVNKINEGDYKYYLVYEIYQLIGRQIYNIVNRIKEDMISTIKATLFLTLLFLCSSNTDLLNEFVASMPVQGKEMDKIILQQFISEGVNAFDLDQIRQKYEVFRRDWVQRMVDYLLRQLDVNEQGARQARKHPEDFYINYDTYKLLLSSESL